MRRLITFPLLIICLLLSFGEVIAQDNPPSSKRQPSQSFDEMYARGDSAFDKGEYETARYYYNVALINARRDEKQENINKAIARIIEAFNHYDRLKNDSLIARLGTTRALGEAGDRALGQGDTSGAILYYGAAIQNAALEGDANTQATLLINRSILFRNLRKFPEVIDHRRKALELLKQYGNPLMAARQHSVNG